MAHGLKPLSCAETTLITRFSVTLLSSESAVAPEQMLRGAGAEAFAECVHACANVVAEHVALSPLRRAMRMAMMCDMKCAWQCVMYDVCPACAHAKHGVSAAAGIQWCGMGAAAADVQMRKRATALITMRLRMLCDGMPLSDLPSR